MQTDFFESEVEFVQAESLVGQHLADVAAEPPPPRAFGLARLAATTVATMSLVVAVILPGEFSKVGLSAQMLRSMGAPTATQAQPAPMTFAAEDEDEAFDVAPASALDRLERRMATWRVANEAPDDDDPDPLV